MIKYWTKYKEIFFLLLISLIPLLWYGTGSHQLIFSNDVGYNLNPVGLFKSKLFAWESTLNFGSTQAELTGFIPNFSIEALLTLLSHSVFNAQKIYVVSWFFTIMIVMYWFVKKIPVFANKPYMAFMAAVLFGINHFQLYAWRIFWRGLFSTYVTLPIFFILLTEYFEERRSLIRTSIFISLTLFLFNGGGSPPTFGALILLVLTLVLYYFLSGLLHKSAIHFLKKCTLLFIVAGLFTFLISSYWLLPYIYYAKNSYSTIVSGIGGVLQTLAWTDVVSANTSILNLLRASGTALWGADVAGYAQVYSQNPFFIILSYLAPVLALSAIIVAKKSSERKYIYIFSVFVVIAVLFSAGTHAPLRGFYVFLLKTIPGYVIFRSPIWKFGGLLWFSYAVLISFTISTFKERIYAYSDRMKEVKKLISHLIPVMFLVIVFGYNFPFFNGNFYKWNVGLDIMEEIPQYVLDFGKWVDTNLNDDSRTLLLPDLNTNWRAEAYKWGYWSLGPATYYVTTKNTLTNESSLINKEPPIVDSLYAALRNNDPIWLNLAKLLNVRYLLLQNDFFYNLSWQPTTPPSVYKSILTNSKDVAPLQTFAEWELYKVTGNTTPIIYTPTVLNFAGTDGTAIKDILEINSNRSLSARPLIVFLDDSITDKVKNNLPEGNNVIIQAKCVLCKPEEITSVTNSIFSEIPYASLLPDSVFYFYISWKEDRMLKNTSNFADQRIDVDLALADKRLSEINQLISRKDRSGSNDLIKLTAQRYSNLLADIMRQQTNLSESARNDYLVRILEYLEAQRRYIREISDQNMISKLIPDLSYSILRATQEIKTNVWMTNEENDQKFTVNLDKADNYSLTISNNKGKQTSVFIDGNRQTAEDTVFLTQGVHQVELRSPNDNLVDSQHATSSGQYDLNYGEKVSFPVSGFSGQNTYQIKFNYRIIQGKAPSVILHQDNDEKSIGTDLSSDNSLKDDGKWNNFTKVFSSNVDAKSGVIDIIKMGFDNSESIFEISNLTVNEMVTPQLLFVRKSGGSSLYAPRITFQKLSPIRYRVHVENATAPYFLNFGEQFDRSWEIYMKNSQPLSLRDGHFTSYFNGDVKEIRPQNIFLDRELFTDVMSKASGGNFHFQTNGFGNGWYITKIGTYDISIVYWPQVFYYFGIIISGIILLISLAILFKLNKLNDKQN